MVNSHKPIPTGLLTGNSAVMGSCAFRSVVLRPRFSTSLPYSVPIMLPHDDGKCQLVGPKNAKQQHIYNRTMESDTNHSELG
jgi:hypothetical protein